jgi:molecular chaperone HtpG
MTAAAEKGRSAAGGDIIAELVHQFSDRFAFYRELIQNSIDAGSMRIEVVLRHQPGSPKGLTTARIADWGEGMDRTIIERYLLTKFRSSKEGDLTKIGKFGIGFLSVFAPAPDLVVVDTGRNGEDWRLLFHPDLTYELLRATEPCEGTAVTLHKAMTADEYEIFAARSGEAVRRWCRHSEADVAFAAAAPDGSPPPLAKRVREEFVVDSPLQAEYRDEHTWIVAGLTRREPPAVGFYNRGLTLLESREALEPGVTFKVVSDHLEHTLTRDNVRRDRHFERILKRVSQLADGPLLDDLRGALETAARRPEPGADYECLLQHAMRLVAGGRLSSADYWFPTTRGACTGEEFQFAVARHGVVLWAEGADPVSEALEASGTPVLRMPEPQPATLLSAARSVVGTAGLQPAGRAFGVAVAPAEPEAGSATSVLASALQHLLRAADAQIQQVAHADLHGAVGDEPWALLPALGVPWPKGRTRLSPFAHGVPKLLCLNAAHHRVRVALQVAQRAPGLAALLLARMIAVSVGALTAQADRRLTEAALAHAPEQAG